MVKNKIMSKEIKRLKPYFDNTTPDKRALAEDLINQAGFMKSVLKKLQEEIENEGTIDEYSNGANQSGMKISARMQSYNTMIKNYIAVNKQLSSLLPKEMKMVNLADPLEEIVND